MASKLLHRLIRDRLDEICHLLEDPAGVPPICLAKNGSPYQAEAKKGAAQEPEDADSVSDSAVRFHMEKAVSLENLVMGVIETAFTQMVCTSYLFGYTKSALMLKTHHFPLHKCYKYLALSLMYACMVA